MTNIKQAPSTKPTSSKRVYDLEERTFEFAKRVRILAGAIPKSLENREDLRQVVRSSGSVGANYREANESLGRKDFLMKCKISRKEAKESAYWLRLILETNRLQNQKQAEELLQEARDLTRILSSIIEKFK